MGMLVVNPDFEWDDYKNILNYTKHGVSFELAQHAFADTKRIILKTRLIASLKKDITASVKLVMK